MWSAHYSCQILIELEFAGQVFEKYSNIEYEEHPSTWSHVTSWRQTDVTNLKVAFHSFTEAPKNFFHWHYSPLWVLACRTMSFIFSYLPPTLSIFSFPALEDLFLLLPPKNKLHLFSLPWMSSCVSYKWKCVSSGMSCRVIWQCVWAFRRNLFAVFNIVKWFSLVETYRCLGKTSCLNWEASVLYLQCS